MTISRARRRPTDASIGGLAVRRASRGRSALLGGTKNGEDTPARMSSLSAKIATEESWPSPPGTRSRLHDRFAGAVGARFVTRSFTARRCFGCLRVGRDNLSQRGKRDPFRYTRFTVAWIDRVPVSNLDCMIVWHCAASASSGDGGRSCTPRPPAGLSISDFDRPCCPSLPVARAARSGARAGFGARRAPLATDQSTRLSIRGVGAVDPVAPQRPHRRSLRSPELHRRPEPQYH